MDDLVVVIRENGERTSEACRLIIAQQVPEQQILVVRESPFYKALEETLRICEQSNRWLIAVDADVLLFPDDILRMVDAANAIREDFFFYQGAVLDKLFMGYRPAGPHLYNCKHAKRALALRHGFEKDLRPETFIRTKMEEEGLAFVQEKAVYGIHDFEQFYSDLYKKAFRHGMKNKRFIKKLNNLHHQFSDLDPDFAVVSRAISDAFDMGEDLKHNLEEATTTALSSLDITEKAKINLTNIDSLTKTIKVDFFDTLSIDERFLAQQRYFPRFRPVVDGFFNRWRFKLS